jgi:hypothetical protein
VEHTYTLPCVRLLRLLIYFLVYLVDFDPDPFLLLVSSGSRGDPHLFFYTLILESDQFFTANLPRPGLEPGSTCSGWYLRLVEQIPQRSPLDDQSHKPLSKHPGDAQGQTAQETAPEDHLPVLYPSEDQFRA